MNLMRCNLWLSLFCLLSNANAARPGLLSHLQSKLHQGHEGIYSHVVRSDVSPSKAELKVETSESTSPLSQRWALLVAGSSGWWNYRHQADVSHAYHLIKEGGVHTANIVTMMYNDIAFNKDNPFPGQVFNKPGGPDVFNGVAIDYQGKDVNVFTLLAVLEGDKDAVKSLGTGKVIDSGPFDEVFLFYSDHGSPGLLGMPTGGMLYADQFLGAIRRKHAKGGYKEMSMYIEACESGSLFQGMLEDDLHLYIATAANANESSWGTYCPGINSQASPLTLLVGNGSKELDTCMGDLFSVSWMEDSETEDPQQETLRVQYNHVRIRTSNNFTYQMGSHVERFGQVKTMESEHVSDYIGFPAKRKPSKEGALVGPQQHGTVDQREADLVPLRYRAAKAPSLQARHEAQVELDAVLRLRANVDAAAYSLAHQLFLHPDTSYLLIQNHGWRSEVVFGSNIGGIPHHDFVVQLVSGSSGLRHPDAPLVDSWDCLREMEQAWTQAYGPFDSYSMRHSRLLANLCNSGLNEQAVLAVVAPASAVA